MILKKHTQQSLRDHALAFWSISVTPTWRMFLTGMRYHCVHHLIQSLMSVSILACEGQIKRQRHTPRWTTSYAQGESDHLSSVAWLMFFHQPAKLKPMKATVKQSSHNGQEYVNLNPLAGLLPNISQQCLNDACWTHIFLSKLTHDPCPLYLHPAIHWLDMGFQQVFWNCSTSVWSLLYKCFIHTVPGG